MTLLERDDVLADEDWDVWLAAILPSYCAHPMAAHHVEFWDWVWAVAPDVRPPAFVGVWARGGAKSTSAEAACVALGARKKRRYGLYVCDTQDRADDHVGNVGSMLESDRMEVFYPEMAARRVGKHGNSKGWRRNRLWTADGFVIDAIGLDTAARGVKLEDQRPDFIVVDDIDGRHDSAKVIQRKIDTLTEAIIPAGAEDLAVLAIQNLIHRDGVFARLVDGRADFLRRRQVSGPVPALIGMVVERQHVDGEPRDVIVAGEATWPGQSVERCQEMIDDMGLRAFSRECQHEVAVVPGALWLTEQIHQGRVVEVPELARLVVGVDPSGGDGEGNDAQGIVAVGRGFDGHGYVVEDATCSLSPMGWGKRAVSLAVDLQADEIVVETNYGGAMAANTIRVAADALVAEGMEEARRFGSAGSAVGVVNASRGKRVRAEPIAANYGEKERPETWDDATMHHVGVLAELEGEMTGWDPEGTGRSPNRVDAMVWAATRLGLDGAKASGRRRQIVAVG